ncbi:MAG: ankyrin repeat domain-containing protein [Candidatus Berkiella sp.]
MVDIIQAIVDGDLAAVKTALSQGSDPNTLGRDGLRAIHYSGMYNQPAIFAELVKAGATVDAKEYHNQTALYYAARAGASTDFIVQIAKAGADLNNQNKIGQTAMHVAARLGKVEALQGLLKSGANPNIKDIVGKTPLLDAVKTNHPEDILLLKAFGASSTIADNYGVTALSAGQQSTNEQIRDLFELAVLDRLQIPANNALFVATVTHDIDGMKAALASGISANSINSFIMTPMHFAALNGFSDEITLLKENGGSIIRTDGDGVQAIHFAAMTHQTSALTTLLDLGAAINAVDKQGNTPLHYAAQFTDEPAFIQKLLDAGASIDTKNIAGETPLHLAAADGNLETVKFLVAHHANVNAVDQQGETPLQEAVKTKHADVATFLSSQNPAKSEGHELTLDLKPESVESKLTVKDVLSSENSLEGLGENETHTHAEPAEAAVSHSVYNQVLEQPVVHVDAIL